MKRCTWENVLSEKFTIKDGNVIVVKQFKTNNIFKIFFKVISDVEFPKGNDLILDFIFKKKEYEICYHTFDNDDQCQKQLRTHNWKVNKMKSDNDKLKLKEEIVNLQNKTNRHDVLQNTTDTAMQEEMKFDMSKGTAHFLQNLIRRQTEQKEEIMDINRKMLYFTDKLKQERNHHIKLGRKIESMSKELDEIESTEQMSNYDTQMYFPDLMKTMSTDTFSFVS